MSIFVNNANVVTVNFLSSRCPDVFACQPPSDRKHCFPKFKLNIDSQCSVQFQLLIS